MEKIIILTMLLLLFFRTDICGLGKKESRVEPAAYRFSFVTDWDLAQGAVPSAEAPLDPHFQYIEKKLGIVPLTQPYEWGGGLGYEQSVRMQISGGDVPEAIRLFTTEFTQDLIASGVLIPLDDLLPVQATRIWNLLTQKQWELVRSFSPDRKIYFIPKIYNTPRVGMIRADWLRAVGINKVPETREELLEAYRAFKNKDANGNGDPHDEIPVSGREYMRWCDDLFVMYGCVMHEGWPEWRWDPQKKIMISDRVSKEMKNAVLFIRQLVEEGLMDPVMPIQASYDWFAKIESDKVGHYFHTIDGIPRRLIMRENGKNPDAEWVYMPNVKVEGVPHQANYAPGLKVNVGITYKAGYPEKILKWLEWSLSEEGSVYANFGIEGFNYIMENGKFTFPDSITPISNKHLYLINLKERSREGYKSMPFGEIVTAVYDASCDDVRYLDTMMMPARIYEGYEDYAPSRATLYRERIAKIILGQLPVSAWDIYVEEWYAKGGKEIQRRVTEWYKKTYNGHV